MNLRRRLLLTVALGFLGLALSLMAGLCIGSLGAGWRASLAALAGLGEPEDILPVIIWHLRLPRVLLAALVGGTLAMAGVVFQALLRNPLAEPYILGVSGGAAVGAILALLAGWAPFPGVTGLAFAGSLATLGLLVLLTWGRAIRRAEGLLLSGVMVNAFCGAVIMFLLSLTQDARLHHLLFWLMGDLSLAAPEHLPWLATGLIPGFLVLLSLARPLNLLLLGEETAHFLGVNVTAISRLLLILTSFLVSLVVCHSGLVGFVGLVVPHLLRLVVGPDHRLLLPASLLGGASFLVLCDLLSRVLPAQGEMPVGVVTALLGAPLFILLLLRSR